MLRRSLRWIIENSRMDIRASEEKTKATEDVATSPQQSDSIEV